MKGTETRIAALERAHDDIKTPILLWADEPPTPEQAARMEEARRAGRHLVIVRWPISPPKIETQGADRGTE